MCIFAQFPVHITCRLGWAVLMSLTVALVLALISRGSLALVALARALVLLAASSTLPTAPAVVAALKLADSNNFLAVDGGYGTLGPVCVVPDGICNFQGLMVVGFQVHAGCRLPATGRARG